jgi:hypothetical protein
MGLVLTRSEQEIDMPYGTDIFSLLGLLIRALGFLVAGFAFGRFVQDAYPKAVWQLQAALALGLFALLAALTHYSSPGSAGAFALGAGGAFLMTYMPNRDDRPENPKK